MNSHDVFIHIHQGCFAGTGAIVRLPQCQWSKPDGYGKISQCITITKHSKAKTVCIFLGIYCIGELYANIHTVFVYLVVVILSFIGLTSWWRHQMETFSASLALCAGNSVVTGEFPSQSPVIRSFKVSLIWAWINCWVNNREAGESRRHRTHYDVIVMHWGRDEIDAILQTTFSNVFSWMKMYEFRLKFQWSLFLRVQLITFRCWVR